MTYLVERLAELRRHVRHLQDLRKQATGRAALEANLSLHNDVMFSLLMMSRLMIDIAGELAARRGDRFDDYTEAIRMLNRDAHFESELVRQLEPLAGFRNVVIHEYVALDLDRVVEALGRLEPIERFIEIVGETERTE